MGEWEGEYCYDCGTLIPESSITVDTAQRRITKPKIYYRVTRQGKQVVLCPACWTTGRIAPTVKTAHG